MPQDTVCGIRRIFKENREKYPKITKGKGILPKKIWMKEIALFQFERYKTLRLEGLILQLVLFLKFPND